MEMSRINSNSFISIILLKKRLLYLRTIQTPFLDVTFDGVHILDEDIVSPVPLISITLDDENEFLLLNEDIDTSLFKIPAHSS